MSLVLMTERAQRLRALAIASAALGAAVGLAWSIVDVTTVAEPLGAPVRLPGWPIRFRLPEGWAIDDARREQDDWSARIVASGPIGKGATATLMIGFDRRTSGEPAFALTQGFLDELVSDLRPDAAGIDAVAFGDVVGAELWATFRAPVGTQSFLIGGSSIPESPGVHVALICGSRLHRVHRTCFRAVCASIERTEADLSREAADLTRPMGFECRVPQGCYVVAAQSELESGISFVADRTAEWPWTIAVWPAVLVEPRTAADLVFDQLLSGTFELDLASPPETVRAGSYEAARGELAHGDFVVIAWAVPIAPHQAVMMRTAVPSSFRDRIDGLCRELASSFRVVPEASKFDAAAALGRGRSLLKRWRASVDPQPPPSRTDVRWYLLEEYLEPAGYVFEQIGPVQRDESDVSPRYVLEGRTRLEWRLMRRSDVLRTVHFRSDRLGDVYEYEERARMKWTRLEQSLRAERRRNGPALEWSAETGGTSRTAKMELGAVFAPEPLLDSVLAECDSLAPGESALIEVVDQVSRAPHYVRCWKETPESGRPLIMSQPDFSSSRVGYRFDAEGRLEEFVLDENRVFRRSTRAEVQRLLSWARLPER